MGVEDLIPEKIPDKGSNYKQYGYHQKEDDLYEWADELQVRFPEEIRIDFIEVSPHLSKNSKRNIYAKAYWREEGGDVIQFIRFAKQAVERYSDRRLKKTLLHEMVHLYTYQKGYHNQVGDSTPIFKYLCGAVGCYINQYRPDRVIWRDLAQPFVDMQNERYDDLHVDEGMVEFWQSLFGEPEEHDP